LRRFFTSPALLVSERSIKDILLPRALERRKICSNAAWLSFLTVS
jgi:hypothetical protein